MCIRDSLLKSSHGEVTLEEDIAEHVLKQFGDNWNEMFTRQFLAEELGLEKPGKGVKQMHAKFS
eukprot:8259896-Karenia_brevis.AAC.1